MKSEGGALGETGSWKLVFFRAGFLASPSVAGEGGKVGPLPSLTLRSFENVYNHRKPPSCFMPSSFISMLLAIVSYFNTKVV